MIVFLLTLRRAPSLVGVSFHGFFFFATFHSVLVRCGSVLFRASWGSFLSSECRTHSCFFLSHLPLSSCFQWFCSEPFAKLIHSLFSIFLVLIIWPSCFCDSVLSHSFCMAVLIYWVFFRLVVSLVFLLILNILTAHFSFSFWVFFVHFLLLNSLFCVALFFLRLHRAPVSSDGACY